MNNKTKIRDSFRNNVFKRDQYKCCFCQEINDLDAHHITDRNEMPNGGYVKENGISLCKKHHLEAEQFHMSNGKNWKEGMHPNDLYLKINSSYDLAYQKSLLLK